jgi:hypothetical protein
VLLQAERGIGLEMLAASIVTVLILRRRRR